MQAGTVIVAADPGDLEIKMGEGVRPIHHDLNAPFTGHVADLLHRQDLPCDVHDVAYHDHSGSFRDLFPVQ